MRSSPVAGLISALLVVRPLRPSGVHATPRLRAFTLPTMAANFQSSSLPARLLVSAVDGHADQESAGIRDTIHDVPLPVLTGGGEFAMILIRDDEAKRALLGLPNSLGWRFHFGIRAPEGQKATLDLAAACVKDLAQRKLVDVEAAERVQEVGLMLFTFVTDPRAQHAPMRVRVFQTRSSSAASSAQDLGTLSATAGWYPFDEVPYERMWQDDVLWLPTLLGQQMDGAYFEGHFVFDGGPGAGSCVLRHNCAFRRQDSQ